MLCLVSRLSIAFFVSSSSGSEQVPAESAFGTVPNQVVYPHTRTALPIDKNGYLYVYVCNETPNIDVFFDNLQVTHVRGPMLEETHYYPFGLTQSGISSKALSFGNPSNKMKFQGQEFASKEFSDGSGLDVYEFKYRMDDCQTGRFWQIDPLAEKYVYNSTYAFSENKVTAHRELEGLEAKLAIYGIGGEGTAYKKSDLNAFQARAQALEKAGYTAVGVHNGDEFVSALKSATASEGSIQTVAVFAHAGNNGIYLNKEQGFYTDNTGPGGNAANVSDVQNMVSSGDIKFEKGATMIFDACNISTPLSNAAPLGVSIAKNLEVSTIAGTDHVSPYKNIENGVFQCDKPFVRTDPVVTITPVTTTSTTTTYITGGAAMGGLPLTTPVTSITTTTTNVRTVTTQQTDIGRVVDFKKY